MKEEALDLSTPSFEEQMLWRYKDLQERYKALQRVGAPVGGEGCLSRSDYRYAPLSCLCTLADVSKAITVVQEELESKCGLIVDEAGNLRDKGERPDPDQITVFEIVYLPALLSASIAA